MVDILAFIKEYAYLIMLVLIFVILILEIAVSKLNIKNPSILSAIDKVLADFIIIAEERFSNGKDKLSYVVLSVEEYISSIFDVKNIKSYEKYITTCVEKILSCPQKKGD